MIAGCTGPADVAKIVNFARDHELLVAVRGGGHNGAGLGTCDDGVVIDLSALNEALHPHSAGGAYVNMMMDEGQERVRASYRDNYDRLAWIKATYDPDNVFRVNQNIEPKA